MFQTLPGAVVLFDFELMLNSLVNSYNCHIETLTPFYGTFARKSDAMTSKQCFKYNHSSTVQSRGIFTSPPTPADDFSEPPRNPAHLSAYNPTAEYFNPAADCGGSAEDPLVTCIIPTRVCGGFPMKSNDVIMIDRYSYLTHLAI